MTKSRRQFEIDDLLANLPEHAVFITTAGQACITLTGGQTFPLSSAYFRDWLTDRFFHRHGKLPAVSSLHQVIAGLRAGAHASPRRLPAFVRIGASDPTNVFIDLANPAADVVEITRTGSQIIQTSQAAFLTTRGHLPFPR